MPNRHVRRRARGSTKKLNPSQRDSKWLAKPICRVDADYYVPIIIKIEEPSGSGHRRAKCYYCGTVTMITPVNTMRGIGWWVYDQHYFGEGGMVGRYRDQVTAQAQEVLDG